MLITQFCDAGKPFFRPHFLGEKFATLDYLVELITTTSGVQFFFAQVKSTRGGYTMRGGRRLKVSVSERDYRRMVAYPAPTYLFGIDEPDERGYFGCVRAGRRRRL